MKFLFTTAIGMIFSISGILAQINRDSDTTMAARIKIEAMEHSQVMEVLNTLTNVIGPRLTNSKGMAAANQWTKQKLESLGLMAEIEPWGEFGRGWDVKSFRMAVTAPYSFQMIAYPKAWSPSTNGSVKGKALYINEKNLDSAKAKYAGKLKNAIVLIGDKVKIDESFDAEAKRLTDSELLVMANSGIKDGAMVSQRAAFRASPQYAAFVERLKIFTWINSQQPAVIVDGGSLSARGTPPNSGIVRVMGASVPLVDESDALGGRNAKIYDPKLSGVTPQIIVAAEQFNQLVELIRNGKEVTIECDLQVDWQTKDTKGYNTIGEWQGSDLKDQVVMIGAHLDSWHASTGATDNAAGVSVMTEVIRILKSLGLQPRRTIRVGFWSGEEQGLLGSGGYVRNHLKDSTGLKSSYSGFSVYYNLDNGGGQIRGIFAQGNEGVIPVFRKWLEPFVAWNASTTTLQNTGSTDHASFAGAGLPGFQFIQDPMAYSAKTWHTNMDMSDHILSEDMKRSAAVIAYFVYMSAMRDDMIPRK